MDSKRVFIAAEINNSVSESIFKLAKNFSTVEGKIKFTAVENLHITLQFLGDVQNNLLPDICKSVELAVKDFGKFKIEIQNILRIPPQRMPRMLWADVGQGGDKLVKLAGKISAATEQFGFAPENKEFQPHITLCRIKKISLTAEKDFDKILQKVNKINFGTTILNEITIYQSILRNQSPEYIPLKRCKL